MPRPHRCSRLPRLLLIVPLLVGLVTPGRVRAQVLVVDVSANIELALQLGKLTAQLEQVYALYQTWQRFRRKLEGVTGRYNLEALRWRIQGIRDDQFGWYTRMADAMAVGDAGAAWRQAVRVISRYPEAVDRLPPEARRLLAELYTNTQLLDAYGASAMGGLGQARMAMRATQAPLERLQADLLDTSDAQTGNVAMLQKITAAQVLAVRGEQVTNQLLTHVIERELARQKALRDAAAQVLEYEIAKKTALTVGTPPYNGGRVRWRLAYGHRAP